MNNTQLVTKVVGYDRTQKPTASAAGTGSGKGDLSPSLEATMRLLVLVCTISLAFAMETWAAAAEPRDIYCQGKRDGKEIDPVVTKKYDQGVGFNAAQYVSQKFVSTLSIRAEDEKERD